MFALNTILPVHYGKVRSKRFCICHPYSTAVEALRILLARAHLDVVVKVLDEDATWDKMKDPQQHTTGVTLLSRHAA